MAIEGWPRRRKRWINGSAPWYQIPPQQVVSVEHPYVVKDVDRGLKTLGGDQEIAKVSFDLEEKTSTDSRSTLFVHMYICLYLCICIEVETD